MQLEALILQNNKAIFKSTIYANTLKEGLKRMESYVLMEMLNDVGECIIRVRVPDHRNDNPEFSLESFAKYTYDYLKNK